MLFRRYPDLSNAFLCLSVVWRGVYQCSEPIMSRYSGTFVTQGRTPHGFATRSPPRVATALCHPRPLVHECRCKTRGGAWTRGGGTMPPSVHTMPSQSPSHIPLRPGSDVAFTQGRRQEQFPNGGQGGAGHGAWRHISDCHG